MVSKETRAIVRELQYDLGPRPGTRTAATADPAELFEQERRIAVERHRRFKAEGECGLRKVARVFFRNLVRFRTLFDCLTERIKDKDGVRYRRLRELSGGRGLAKEIKSMRRQAWDMTARIAANEFDKATRNERRYNLRAAGETLNRLFCYSDASFRAELGHEVPFTWKWRAPDPIPLLDKVVDLFRLEGFGDSDYQPDSQRSAYLPADEIYLRHGIRPERLSEAVRESDVRSRQAPRGTRDSQGKQVRILYHELDAIKKFQPRRRARAARTVTNYETRRRNPDS